MPVSGSAALPVGAPRYNLPLLVPRFARKHPSARPRRRIRKLRLFSLLLLLFLLRCWLRLVIFLHRSRLHGLFLKRINLCSKFRRVFSGSAQLGHFPAELVNLRGVASKPLDLASCKILEATPPGEATGGAEGGGGCGCDVPGSSRTSAVGLAAFAALAVVVSRRRR